MAIKPTGQGHVVKDFWKGGTHISICDDYCRNVTHAEGEEVMRKIGEMAADALARKACAEKEKQEV